MDSRVKMSTLTLAVVIELTARTLKKLEGTGKISSLDPTHRVELNQTVLATQLAQAIVTATR
jgi:hypothetical protein